MQIIALRYVASRASKRVSYSWSEQLQTQQLLASSFVFVAAPFSSSVYFSRSHRFGTLPVLLVSFSSPIPMHPFQGPWEDVPPQILQITSLCLWSSICSWRTNVVGNKQQPAKVVFANFIDDCSLLSRYVLTEEYTSATSCSPITLILSTFASLSRFFTTDHLFKWILAPENS